MPKFWVYELPSTASLQDWGSVYDVNGYGSAAGNIGGHVAIWNGVPPSPPDILPIMGYPFAMNDNGDVVGNYTPDWDAFLYRNGGPTEYLSAILGADECNAWDINNDRVVVGHISNPAGIRGYVYDSDGGSVSLVDPFPGDTYSIAYGINDQGHAVGVSLVWYYGPAHLFINRNGQTDNLGEVHWSTVVKVGNGDMITGWKSFTGGPLATAFRIDASVTDPEFQNLGHSTRPGFNQSNGVGINADGVIVGHSHGPGGILAFVDFPPSSAEAGFYDLDESVIVNFDGWTFETANGISDTGYIVGTGSYKGEGRRFLLGPPPDDAPAWLTQMKSHLGDFMERFVMLFGGATRGGAGIGILPNGRPVPIPPHQWKYLSAAEQDVLIGRALRNLGSLLDNRERGDIVQRAGTEVVESAIAELHAARERPEGESR